MPRKSIKGFRDLKRTHRGFPIIGGSAIVDVINTGIVLGAWAPIQMPADVACKQLIISERSQIAWKLSDSPVGDAYSTIQGTLAMEMAAIPGQILFYAEGGENGSAEDVGVAVKEFITSDDQHWQLTAIGSLSIGDYVKADNEICRIWDLGSEAGHEFIRVTRAQFGTEATTHELSTTVYKYNVNILEIILID